MSLEHSTGSQWNMPLLALIVATLSALYESVIDKIVAMRMEESLLEGGIREIASLIVV